MVKKVNANEFDIMAGTTVCRIRIDGRGIYALLDAAVQVRCAADGVAVVLVDASEVPKTLRISAEGLSVDGMAVCNSIDVLCGLLEEDIRRDIDIWAASYPNVRQFLKLTSEEKCGVLVDGRSVESRRILEWYMEQLK
jgi:hypothetical protein